jgi:uncharacterized protein YcfJ
MTRALVFVVALAGTVVPPTAAAGEAYFDYARVVDVEPVRIERSRASTERRCTTVPALPAGDVRRHDPGLDLVGSLRAEAAARPVERCRYVTVRQPYEEAVAWRVTYRYGGRTGTLRTAEHPGDSVRVRIDVAPRR